MRFCLVTTCSGHKPGDGRPYAQVAAAGRSPGGPLLRARRELYRAIQRGAVDGDLRGAVEGPDFGGGSHGAYEPAVRRYGAGSFVSALARGLSDDATLKPGLFVCDQLASILRGLSEDRSSHSEPDVIVDFGKEGVVVIEAKYRSRNDRQAGTYSGRDRGYLDGVAFTKTAGGATLWIVRVGPQLADRLGSAARLNA